MLRLNTDTHVNTCKTPTGIHTLYQKTSSQSRVCVFVCNLNLNIKVAMFKKVCEDVIKLALIKYIYQCNAFPSVEP